MTVRQDNKFVPGIQDHTIYTRNQATRTPRVVATANTTAARSENPSTRRVVTYNVFGMVASSTTVEKAKASHGGCGHGHGHAGGVCPAADSAPLMAAATGKST